MILIRCCSLEEAKLHIAAKEAADWTPVDLRVWSKDSFGRGLCFFLNPWTDDELEVLTYYRKKYPYYVAYKFDELSLSKFRNYFSKGFGNYFQRDHQFYVEEAHFSRVPTWKGNLIVGFTQPSLLDTKDWVDMIKTELSE